MNNQLLMEKDPELYDLLRREEARQRDTLDMMASESIQDELSLGLAGSIFGNKTAVGLPGKQRLLGAEVIDELERLAADRACALFGAEHANMLTYSGTTANMCVSDELLNNGDQILALDPEHGSHASHGRAAHITSRLHEFIHFGVDRETQLIDYDALRETALRCRPKVLLVGSSSYPRLFDFPRLAEIAHAAGALLMVDMAHFTGLTAAGVIPSCVPYADVVTASCTKTMCSVHTGFILCKKALAKQIDQGVYPGMIASMHPQTIAASAWALHRASTPEFAVLMAQTLRNAASLVEELKARQVGVLTGGTDCHMFVLDLRGTAADGVSLSENLGRMGLWVNSKSIPWDVSPRPMGVRAGCTVLTQRGMTEAEMPVMADLIARAVSWGSGEPVPSELAVCRETIAALCRKFPG